jgi:hypothetical protein
LNFEWGKEEEFSGQLSKVIGEEGIGTSNIEHPTLNIEVKRNVGF